MARLLTDGPAPLSLRSSRARSLRRLRSLRLRHKLVLMRAVDERRKIDVLLIDKYVTCDDIIPD